MPDVYQTPKGVKIGLNYQRPVPQMSRDEELIQSALMGLKPVARFPWKSVVCWIPVVALISFIFWRFS